MNLKAVSALYRLPAETTLGQLDDEQLKTLDQWGTALHFQSQTCNRSHYQPDMLLTEWMDREVEAAQAGTEPA